MGETVDSSQSFLRRHWEWYKEFWSDRFSIMENYSTFIKGREQPLSWSASDVEEFIASDPVHGPALKTAREAVNYGAVGSLIGAVSTAGAALSFGTGVVFGWTFGHEIANHYLQLYRIDTMGAHVKFLEWQQSKTEGRSS